METFIPATLKVYHMEPDLYRGGGFILYSDGSSMKSTDGKVVFTIIGDPNVDGYREGKQSNAIFNHIYGFLQTKRNLALLVDRKNHCLRSLYRDESKSEVYTGSCQNGGYSDGPKPLFNEPHSIIRDLKHSKRLMISDLGNNAIRFIMEGSTLASTYIKSPNLVKPRGMSQDPTTGDFYLITYHALYKITYNNRQLTLVAGSTKGDVNVLDGPFSKASFSYPSEILWISNDLLVIAGGRKLRAVNVKLQTVGSVCSGVVGHRDGSLQRCELYYPNSLLLVGGTLYIGEKGHIRMIKGLFHFILVMGNCGLVRSILEFKKRKN